MAISEVNGLQRYKDADGNVHILYPVTKAELVDGLDELMDGHTGDKNNPHSVTKAQVGLGNVDNTKDADKPVSTAQAAAIADAKKAGTDAAEALATHKDDKDNPHGVTAEQIGAATEADVKAVVRKLKESTFQKLITGRFI